MDRFNLVVDASHLQGQETERLDAFLARHLGWSRSFAQTQIELGRVLVAGHLAKKPSSRVRPGDRIEAEASQEPLPNASAPLPMEGELDVVFEDPYLLVINKPQGLVVHPAPSHKGPTLVNFLLHRLSNPDLVASAPERPGIVHRLDKGTSGLLLVAKDRPTCEQLSALFQSRSIRKTYEALCWGALSGQGRFESAMGRDPTNRLKMSSRARKRRTAVTDWRALRVFGPCTHVELHPHTGRTHQLRVHLSESGHPIIGDPLYGRGLTRHREGTLPANALELVRSLEGTLLHAAALEFDHPHTGQRLALHAPRPDFFDKLLKALADSSP